MAGPRQRPWSRICSVLVCLATALTLGGCADFKGLTGTTSGSSSSQPLNESLGGPTADASAPDAGILLVSLPSDPARAAGQDSAVSSTDTSAGTSDNPAPEPDGSSLTPEAAAILKEHGYDPAGSAGAEPQKPLELVQEPTKAGGQMPIPEVDPFAKPGEGEGEVEEYDPFEKVNQYTFEFNYKLDRYLIKPVAKAYNYVMPDVAQQGISNFFTNIRFVPRMLNNVLQAKFKGAAIEGGRFLINTTIGVAGLWDPAKIWFNLQTSVEDSGQTFGYYGVKPGPYLVIPFLGSFTLRDGLGYIADLALDPFNWFVLPIIKLDGAPKLVTKNDTITFAQIGMRGGIIVNERSLNLEKFQGVEEATLDLYSAVRNAYLQQRSRLIRE